MTKRLANLRGKNASIDQHCAVCMLLYTVWSIAHYIGNLYKKKR
jgi:hypothetical protein